MNSPAEAEWSTYVLHDLSVDFPREPSPRNGHGSLRLELSEDGWHIEAEVFAFRTVEDAERELAYDYKSQMDTEGYSGFDSKQLSFGDRARFVSADKAGRVTKILELRSDADLYRLQAISETEEGDRICGQFIRSVSLGSSKALPERPPPAGEPYDRAWWNALLARFASDPLAAVLEARLRFDKITPALLAEAQREAADECRSREEYVRNLKMNGLGLDAHLNQKQAIFGSLVQLAEARGDPYYAPPWPENARAVLEGRADLRTLAGLMGLPPQTRQMMDALIVTNPPMAAAMQHDLWHQLKFHAALALPRAELLALFGVALKPSVPAALRGLTEFLSSTLQSMGFDAKAAQSIAANVANAKPGATAAPASPKSEPAPPNLANLDSVNQALRRLEGVELALKAGNLNVRKCVEQVFAARSLTDAEWDAIEKGKSKLEATLAWPRSEATRFAQTPLAWARAGDLQGSRIVFEALTLIAPSEGLHPFVLGDIYAKLKRRADAIEAYSQAIERYKRQSLISVPAWTRRGALLLEAQWYSAAADDLLAAIRHDPQGKDPDANEACRLCRDNPELLRVITTRGQEDLLRNP